MTTHLNVPWCEGWRERGLEVALEALGLEGPWVGVHTRRGLRREPVGVREVSAMLLIQQEDLNAVRTFVGITAGSPATPVAAIVNANGTALTLDRPPLMVDTALDATLDTLRSREVVSDIHLDGLIWRVASMQYGVTWTCELSEQLEERVELAVQALRSVIGIGGST